MQNLQLTDWKAEEVNLLTCTISELHTTILERRADHGDIETACSKRIAAIPRLPLGPHGRWWHYANASAYPFGN